VVGVTPPNQATIPVQNGINSLTIAADLSNTTIFVPGGIPTATITGQVQQSEIRATNALTAALGRLATVTVGDWQSGKLSANSLGSFKSIGSTARGLQADVANARFSVGGSFGPGAAAAAIGSFVIGLSGQPVSPSGSLLGATFNVPGRVATFTVLGPV